MTIDDLRARRMQERIPGDVLGRVADMERSRISRLENGHAMPTQDELQTLARALDRLVKGRRRAQKVLQAAGWPALQAGEETK